jgi:feruloyl esterase
MALKWTSLLCIASFPNLIAAKAIDDFEQRCLSFTPESLVKNSSRTVLEYVPANTTIEFPDNDASCGRPSQLVSADMCRVAMSIPTSNRYIKILILSLGEIN